MKWVGWWILVSTTVVSTRYAAAFGEAHGSVPWSPSSVWICLITSPPSATPQRPIVLASKRLRAAHAGEVDGIPDWRVPRKLEHAIAPVAEMCLRISRRNTTSAGVPNRHGGWRLFGMATCRGPHTRPLPFAHPPAPDQGAASSLRKQIAHLFGDQAVAEAALCTPISGSCCIAPGLRRTRHPVGAVSFMIELSKARCASIARSSDVSDNWQASGEPR